MENTLDKSKRTPLQPHEIAGAGFPKRFWGLTRADFVDRPYYQKMHDYILSMDDVMREGRSLFIYGPSSSGKSALAYYIGRVFREYTIFTKFVSASEIQEAIESKAFDPKDEETWREKWERVPLLIVDGLSLETVRPHQHSHLVQLFEDRFLAARPTILTCPITEIGELGEMPKYPKFFLDKMTAACTMIRCPKR